jgi:hypothetical protein
MSAPADAERVKQTQPNRSPAGLMGVFGSWPLLTTPQPVAVTVPFALCQKTIRLLLSALPYLCYGEFVMPILLVRALKKFDWQPNLP